MANVVLTFDVVDFGIVSSATVVPIVFVVAARLEVTSGALAVVLLPEVATEVLMVVNVEDVGFVAVVLALSSCTVVVSSATKLLEVIGIFMGIVVLILCGILAIFDEVLMAGGGVLEPVVV